MRKETYRSPYTRARDPTKANPLWLYDYTIDDWKLSPFMMMVFGQLNPDLCFKDVATLATNRWPKPEKKLKSKMAAYQYEFRKTKARP